MVEAVPVVGSGTADAGIDRSKRDAFDIHRMNDSHIINQFDK
jgi:hypothetical protein